MKWNVTFALFISLVPENSPFKIVENKSLCNSHINIWSKCFFLLEVDILLNTIFLFELGDGITWALFLIFFCKPLTGYYVKLVL